MGEGLQSMVSPMAKAWRCEVCGICGHTLVGDAPDKCPVCGAPKARFAAVA